MSEFRRGGPESGGESLEARKARELREKKTKQLQISHPAKSLEGPLETNDSKLLKGAYVLDQPIDVEVHRRSLQKHDYIEKESDYEILPTDDEATVKLKKLNIQMRESIKRLSK